MRMRFQKISEASGQVGRLLRTGAADVHEFATPATRPQNHERNTADLNAFVTRLTDGEASSVPAGTLIGPIRVPRDDGSAASVSLYLGKVTTRTTA